jgi:outer membrane protein TolC
LLAITSAGIDQSKARIDEVRSYYYPSLALQGSWAYLSNVPVINMQIGGQPFILPLGTHPNYDAKLALAQTIYAGGMREGLEMARVGKAISEDSLARQRQGVVYSVRSAFDNVLLLKQMLSLTRPSQDLARDHLKTVQTMHDQGFVSSYDVLRTSVQVDNLTPQINQIQSGVKLALDGLKLIIGLPEDQNIDITGDFNATPVDVNLEESTNQALIHRRELKMLDKAIQISRLNRNITKANYLPAVGAGVAYDLENPTGLGGSGWGTNMTVSLGLRYTLFDGLKTSAQLREEDAATRQLLVARDLLQAAVTLEVREAVTSMQTARSSLNAARNNIAAADSGVKLSEARYAAGQGSNLDVLDSQLALFQAQVNEVQSLRDYDDARARLTKAIGKEEE